MNRLLTILVVSMVVLDVSESMDSKQFEALDISRGEAWTQGKKLFGPGFGWDYLTGSISGYPLIEISFEKGQTTNDQLFLVPDCFVVEDRKLANFMDISEVIESSMDYTDITSSSMAVGASASVGFLGFGGSMAGSYSENRQHMINEQTKSKTVTLRTQYLDHRYTLMLNSNCALNKGFESFIFEIAKCLKNNDTEWANYLAQEVVRDYGTHFIKKASLGGIFYSEDYLSTSYWFKSENSYSEMKIHASMKFRAGFFKANANYDQFESSSHNMQQDYSKSVSMSKAQAIGGNYKPGNKIEEWATTLDANLAIIDKEADLISSFITYYNFQSIERAYLAKTRKLIENAINDYLRINQIKGCLNRRAVTYQPFSNFNAPELCKEEYIFGAFYEKRQECETPDCQTFRNFTKPNILTNEASCPQGYRQVLHQFNIPKIELFTLTECKGGPGFQKSPILFGGIYSTDLEDNPVTGAKKCPSGYLKYPLVITDKNDKGLAQICLSRSFDDGVQYAIPFMGFLSTCDDTKIDQLKCGITYELYFVANYNGCFLYYCTRVKDIERRTIQKPPFVEMPNRNYRGANIQE